jgi:hypothetical protein
MASSLPVSGAAERRLDLAGRPYEADEQPPV